jgi:hypothetical protein
MRIILIFLVLASLVSPLASGDTISFPITPLGECFDGVQRLAAMDAYKNASIAYNSTMFKHGHVWLINNDKVIDSYWGEKDNSSINWIPEKTFNTFEEFENSLKIMID